MFNVLLEKTKPSAVIGGYTCTRRRTPDRQTKLRTDKWTDGQISDFMSPFGVMISLVIVATGYYIHVQVHNHVVSTSVYFILIVLAASIRLDEHYIENCLAPPRKPTAFERVSKGRHNKNQ